LVRFNGDAARASAVYASTQPLTPSDVTEAVFWATTLPPHVNINVIELMPVAQSFGPFPIHRQG
jgi:3-hydroxy acid dehydrogenase / malonic semialdehyde reductase